MAERVRWRTGDEIPDVGNGLWTRVRDAVVAATGADKSLWNGVLRYTGQDDEHARGSTAWSGAVHLSREWVVEPLQEMYASLAERYEPGGPAVTEEQAKERRRALATVVEQFAALAVPEQHQLAQWQAGLGPSYSDPIEQGVTNAWRSMRLNEIAGRVLPPELAKQISSVSTDESYPDWTPAARTFAETIAFWSDRTDDQVLALMNREAVTGKARAAANLLFESSELPRLIPAGEQADVRADIRRSIDDGFSALADTPDDLSTQRGYEIADAAAAVVRDAERRYQPVPDVGNGLYGRIQDTVLAQTGADKSLWNGRIRYTGPEDPAIARSTPDGTVLLSLERVVKPLQEMYQMHEMPEIGEEGRQSTTEEQRMEHRRALAAVVGQFAELAVPEQHQIGHRWLELGLTRYEPIEQGVTEAWSHSQLDLIADGVLPPELAEEISSVSIDGSYAAWTRTAQTFAKAVANRSDVTTDEVLVRMTREPWAEKAQAAADLLFDKSQLPRLVPDAEQPAVRNAIGASIDAGFAVSEWLDPYIPDDLSTRRGFEIAEAAAAVVHEAERRYRPEPQQGLAPQEAQQVEEPQRGSGGLGAHTLPNQAEQAWGAAPAPEDRRPVDPRLAFAKPSQTPATAMAREVDTLRGILDGQARASGAPRVRHGGATEARKKTGMTDGQSARRGTDTSPPSR